MGHLSDYNARVLWPHLSGKNLQPYNLTDMNNRIYNILFHTHTVSGIVISVALYVIFFAGSFSFFKEEIVAWERDQPITEDVFKNTNFDRLMDTVGQRYGTYGRDIIIGQTNPERRVYINMTGSKDSLATEEDKARQFFYLDIDNMDSYDYQSGYSFGEFLYRLHFFAQLNLYGISGYILAGFVAFFFLFAIITGVWVHWNKIISNFYLFRPRAKLKTMWTDAHTVLGMLGLPYQFVYAVTGVYLIIGTTLFAPPVASFLYNNNTEKLYSDMGVTTSTFPMVTEKLPTAPNINSFIEKTKKQWGDFELRSVSLQNYGNANMHISIEGLPLSNLKFAGKGLIIYNAATGEVVSNKSPYGASSYLDGTMEVLRKLHFGDFGGIGMRIIYFILGLLSCFVIISGVMIWLVARDKKSIPEKQRRFNAWVVRIYLAVCLSMYPVTAFTFLTIKIFSADIGIDRMSFMYHIFFYSWLLLSILFAAKRDIYFTNKYTLLMGSMLGFMIPIANGIMTGNWIWLSYHSHYQIFFMDAFWIVLSLVTTVIALKLKKKEKTKDIELAPDPKRFVGKQIAKINE